MLRRRVPQGLLVRALHLKAIPSKILERVQKKEMLLQGRALLVQKVGLHSLGEEPSFADTSKLLVSCPNDHVSVDTTQRKGEDCA